MSLVEQLPNQTRKLFRRFCLVLIAILYVISVPWYREPGDPLRIWFGLPDWVATALLCYVAVAVLNGIAWWMAEIHDEPADEADPGSDGMRLADHGRREAP